MENKTEVEETPITVSILVRGNAPEAVIAEVNAFARRLSGEQTVAVAVGQVNVCRECGFTDDEACLGGCWWVTPEADICSACAPAETAADIDPLRRSAVQKVDPDAPRAAAPTIDPGWRGHATGPIVCPACETEIAIADASNRASIDVKCPECGHRWTQLQERTR